MLPDYLVLGDVEIVNTVRADAYGSSLASCGLTADCLDCPDLINVINDGRPYLDVTEAPWYDVVIPESARVYGVAGLSVTGLNVATWPNPGNGTDSPTGAQRDFAFEVLLTAGDECAMSYAIGWLASALNDPACGSGGCSGQMACMLACCPGSPEDDVIRNIFGVRTVEGPAITKQASGNGQVYAIATFTLRTSYPQIYREPLTWNVQPFLGTVVEVNLPEVYQDCADPPPCTSDPFCPRPSVPGLPNVPMDPCYPTEFTAKRSLLTIPKGTIPSGLDSSLVVAVTTGAQEARNFILRVHNNPFGVPCERLPELNPCRACTDLVVTYIPPNGGLLIDGRTRTESIWCGVGQQRSTGVPVVYGTPYMPFTHPVWACGGATCLEIMTTQEVGPETLVTISLVPRQEAA